MKSCTRIVEVFIVLSMVFHKGFSPIPVDLDLSIENQIEDPLKTVIEVLSLRVNTAFVVNNIVEINKVDLRKKLRDYYSTIIQHIHTEISIPIILYRAKKKNYIDIVRNKVLSERGRLEPKLIILVFDIFTNFFENTIPMLENYPNSLYIVVSLDALNYEMIFENVHLKNLNELWIRFRIYNIYFIFSELKDIFVYVPTNPEGKNVVTYNPDEFRRDFSKRNCDFKGYGLNITIFKRDFTSEIKKESEMFDHLKSDVKNTMNICGVDGYFMGNMVKYLNFTAEIIKPLDNEEFGAVFPNGTLTGTIYDLTTRRADIALNSRFITYYGLDSVRLTFPIFDDDFCLVAPKAQIIPYWIDLFLTLKPEAYGIFLGISFSMAILWWFLNKVMARGSIKTLCDTIFALFDNPLSLAMWNGDKIFIITCIVFSSTFSAIFQAFMRTGYSAPNYYKDINSLEEADNSGLRVALSSAFRDMFGEELNPTLMSIKNKNITVPSPTINRVNSMKVFAVQRLSDVYTLIKINFTDEEGNPTLHVVKECPINYRLSYMVYEDFPFMDCVDNFILKVVESGLNEKWYTWTQFITILQQTYKRKSRSLYEKVKFGDLQGGFYLLFIGYILSLCIFVWEILHKTRKEKRTSIQENSNGIPFMQ